MRSLQQWSRRRQAIGPHGKGDPVRPVLSLVIACMRDRSGHAAGIPGWR